VTAAAKMIGNAHVVIFDCDDTVIATAKSRWKVLIATARSFGVALTEDTIHDAWGTPFDRLIRSIVPTIDYDEFVTRYRAAMRTSRAEPTPGARELLAHLAARSTRMEIVTSSSRDLITQDLDDLDLTTYFARIYGHEETAFHKPDPRVLDVVIENLTRRGHELSELVYIGDSVRDFQVAAAQFVEFVAVLSGIESVADFTAAGLPRDRIVDDLTQLISTVPPVE
jgi:HAD superfamily hydrolase (TIGR01549 family)